jgi:hypothetical protein
VSSAFRLLRRSGVGCSSQGPRFSSGSALGPSHDGIRRMRRTNLPRRPCRKTYDRHKDSKRTRLIHRPCGDIAPPVGGIRVSPVVFYCARHRRLLRARRKRRRSSANGWWRPDCVAGHVRFELRNVAANYPFERSHRFAGIQPKYGHRDCSRLSCGIWICSSGLALPGSSASVVRRC